MSDKTFGGLQANPVSDLIRKSTSPVLNIFFLGSGTRAIVHQRALVPSKYISKAKAANCGVMFGRFTKEVIDWADVVVFQRVGGRTMEAAAQYCKMRGKGTIYDIDDDVFNYPEAKEYETSDLERVANDVQSMMNAVDAIMVSEENIKLSIQEKAFFPIEQGAKPIYVVPNYIDIEQWDAPASKNYVQPDFVIGWAGGHYHSEDLKILEEPIRQILKEFPKVKFVTIGDKIDSLLKEFPDRVYFHEFVDIADFPDLMHKLKFSIGLAPLSESAFSDSRSNIRLLHYSLLGIPTIASNFGAYARSYRDKFPMKVVENTKEEWIAAIRELINRKEHRDYLGLAAREAVVQKYKAKKLVPQYLHIFRKAINIAEHNT